MNFWLFDFVFPIFNLFSVLTVFTRFITTPKSCLHFINHLFIFYIIRGFFVAAFNKKFSTVLVQKTNSVPSYALTGIAVSTVVSRSVSLSECLVTVSFCFFSSKSAKFPCTFNQNCFSFNLKVFSLLSFIKLFTLPRRHTGPLFLLLFNCLLRCEPPLCLLFSVSGYYFMGAGRRHLQRGRYIF